MVGASLNPRRCKAKGCRETFIPKRSFENWCSAACAWEIAKDKLAKKKAAEAKVQRAKDRKSREYLKTRGQWLKEAKVAIQQARRLEELAKGRGCMSCLRTRAEVEGSESWTPGGFWDGAHFGSKGARPELALEPLNIWLSCKPCNAGSGKYARKGYTVMASFEENLRKAEGDALVDWLKGPHEPKHYTVEDLKTIRDTYRAKVRELKRGE